MRVNSTDFGFFASPTASGCALPGGFHDPLALPRVLDDRAYPANNHDKLDRAFGHVSTGFVCKMKTPALQYWGLNSGE